MRSVRRSQPVDATKTPVSAFITGRVDYCNSGFSRVAATHLLQLKSILNATAQLIVKRSRYDQITATIREGLHWLPIQQRIEHKLCDLVHESIHHIAPVYLTKLCVAVSTLSRANLRSAARSD